ncbi:MAG: HAD family phosphatase [Spirochaetales bacterium]|nr:HAD family phosphatase [Spirochaetales bacterium]
MKNNKKDSAILAVIFDMDGVLVDSEPFIAEAAMRMFSEHGLEVKKEDFLPFVGAGENRYLGGVAEKYGFPLDIERDKARTYQIYAEIVKGRIDPLPGAVEFVKELRDISVPAALATSADRTKMEVNLQEIGLPPESFNTVINGLDIERKKPHPDIYLEAALRLGKAPEYCLVVEDAVNGVKAALRAGMYCLALEGSFSREELSGAHWFAENLAAVPDSLRRALGLPEKSKG